MDSYEAVKSSGTVRDAVDRYMQENGFTRSEYAAKSVPVKVGPITFQLANGPARQRAIPLHDIHHAVTGYGTDLIGEAEIAVWELRGGCTNAFLWAINIAGLIAGLFISPRRLLMAYRRARGAKTLYRLGLTPEEVGDMRLEELRAKLGIAPGGVADTKLRGHAWGPAPVG
jgi:ubiquinone biosynthesis protein Coq4